MKLQIGNIEPGTSDDEILDLVKKYAPTLECTRIQHALTASRRAPPT
jgi:hypothetical protein